MIVYVLTHCAAEENYTPEVFTDVEKAYKRLKKVYEDCIEDDESVVSCDLYDTSACIVYVDDSYDKLDIFSVEVE